MRKWWKSKHQQRRAELRGIAAQLGKLSNKEAPTVRGVNELRSQVRQHLNRIGGLGPDSVDVRSIDQVIDSYVVELKTEILRQHKAEDMQLGELDAKLEGLTTGYRDEEQRTDKDIKAVEYQQSSAQRVVEDRDTTAPAGPDGVEDGGGYQHGNPGELVGRGVRGWFWLYVVLFLAMVADFITFRQVVERVFNDALVAPLVVALTGTTTYVAHKAGEFFRENRSSRPRRRPVGASVLGGVWLVMGFVAFGFRLWAPAPVSDPLRQFATGGAPNSSGGGSSVLSALMLLVLYLLTGAIALTAGYQRPQLEVAQYQRANRWLRRRGPRLSALRRDLAEAEALQKQLRQLRDDRKEQFTVEVGRCEAAAVRVKAEAAIIARYMLRSESASWWRRLTARRRDEPITGEFSEEPLEPGEPMATTKVAGSADLRDWPGQRQSDEWFGSDPAAGGEEPTQGFATGTVYNGGAYYNRNDPAPQLGNGSTRYTTEPAGRDEEDPTVVLPNRGNDREYRGYGEGDGAPVR